ncbi:MAG: RdgB/HAM1 family non-canonical purine NTP pyrophosphatase [Fibrobacterota bacterium]
MKLLAATLNQGKIREIREIFENDEEITIVTPELFPGMPEVEETGGTFKENALLKANAAASYTGLPVISDDSGLEVYALDMRPGVFSARYAGNKADDEENVAKLLNEMDGRTNRKARFRCVIAYIDPAGANFTAEGSSEGVIAEKPAGKRGFGYDPIFIPDGEKRTFAEIDPAVKNMISHRSRALKDFREKFQMLGE